MNDARNGCAKREGCAPENAVEPAIGNVEAWEADAKEAFGAMHAPAEVRLATLELIESKRAASPKDGSMGAVRASRRFKALRRAFAAAACLLVVAAGVMGYRAYALPAAYVGVDVNPSFELSVNSFGTVLEAQALNEDAAAVLDETQVHGRELEEALDALLAGEGMAPYLGEDAFVEIGITSTDEGLAARLQESSQALLDDLPCEGACRRVDENVRMAAHEAGMGVGRYLAAQELIALDPTLTLEDCAQMSMREIRDRLSVMGSEDVGAEDEAAGVEGGGQELRDGSGRGTGAHSRGTGSAGGEGRHSAPGA